MSVQKWKGPEMRILLEMQQKIEDGLVPLSFLDIQIYYIILHSSSHTQSRFPS